MGPVPSQQAPPQQQVPLGPPPMSSSSSSDLAYGASRCVTGHPPPTPFLRPPTPSADWRVRAVLPACCLLSSSSLSKAPSSSSLQQPHGNKRTYEDMVATAEESV